MDGRGPVCTWGVMSAPGDRREAVMPRVGPTWGCEIFRESPVRPHPPPVRGLVHTAHKVRTRIGAGEALLRVGGLDVSIEVSTSRRRLGQMPRPYVPRPHAPRPHVDMSRTLFALLTLAFSSCDQQLAGVAVSVSCESFTERGERPPAQPCLCGGDTQGMQYSLRTLPR